MSEAVGGEFCGQQQPHGAHWWQTPPVYGTTTWVHHYHQCGGHVAPVPLADDDRALAEATIRRCQAEGGNLADSLAEMIAGVRADTWDEGYDARVRFCRDGHHGNPERNPYRGGAVTG